MDLRQLRVFRTILETGSVSEAARKLNISQPAVSKTLAGIEQEMEIQLFERIAGRLVPTMHAQALVPDVNRIFADFTLFNQTARELRTGNRGHVKLAVTPSSSASLVPLAISAFKQKHAAVDFSILATTTQGVISLVEQNEAEIGICQPNSGEASVVATHLRRGAVKCVMPADHELTRLKNISPRDLEGFDIISISTFEATGAKIAEAFRKEGYRLRPIAEANQSLTACALVAAGVGIALVDPFFPIETSFTNLRSRQFIPTIDISVDLMISGSRSLSPLALAFRDELVAAAKPWRDTAASSAPKKGRNGNSG